MGDVTLEAEEKVVIVTDAGFASLLHYLSFDLLKCVVMTVNRQDNGRPQLKTMWHFVVDGSYDALHDEWLHDKVGITDARALMKSNRLMFDIRAKARISGEARLERN